MKRLPQVRIGTERIELEQPEGLFVAHSKGRGVPRPGRTIGSWRGHRLVAPETTEVPEEVVEGWAAAGWTLVALVEGEGEGDLEELRYVAPIFRTPEGQWWIGTDRLVVRLSDELPEPEAEGLLGRFGLSVVRRLKMKPHLYEVRAEVEPLAAAAALQEAPQVQYAEPQFLQSIGPR